MWIDTCMCIFFPRNATNHFRNELLGSPSTYCVFLCFVKPGFQSFSLCQEEVGSLQEEGSALCLFAVLLPLLIKG